MKSCRFILGVGITGVLSVLSVALLMAPSTVSAGTGLTVQPIKISQTMKPGDTVSGKVLLTNASPEDVTVDLSIQDFVPSPGSDSFNFVGRAEGVTTVRDWIKFDLPKDSFTFKEGDIREIPYTITAPKDAEPGSHFGVLFFKAVRTADANASFKVGTQVGVLVFVTIPGKFQQKGTIKDFTSPSFLQTGPVVFNMQFENTGTVHFEPKGTIEVTNMFGSKVGSVPIEGYAVLPTGIKKMSFTWHTVGLLLGKYHAVANVYNTEGEVISTASTDFLALPVWYAVICIVILIVLYVVIRFLKRRVKFTVSLKK